MRCKRVITVREWAERTHCRITETLDFSGESDVLRSRNTVSWPKNSKSTSHITWSDPCVVAVPVNVVGAARGASLYAVNRPGPTVFGLEIPASNGGSEKSMDTAFLSEHCERAETVCEGGQKSLDDL